MGASGIVRFSGTEEFKLTKAILVYAGSDNKAGCATVHDIYTDKCGKPTILAGVAATAKSVAAIAALLTRQVKTGGFLPPTVLSVGIDSLVWWVPPAKSRIFFDCEEFGGKRSAETPHPGLIFRVSGAREWSVFAVKGKDRPTLDSLIYIAPYFNTYADGAICTGNVTIPSGSAAGKASAWEKAFFDSYFTHPNIQAPNKLVEYNGGAYRFWRDMLDGKYKRFPERVLVETGHRLEYLLDHSM